MIDRFYNTYAIVERFTNTQSDSGQLIKTWSVSTTIKGIKQNRSGNINIINNIEKIRLGERFYCNVSNLSSATDRLLFSTNSYNYVGNSSASSMLTSYNAGDLYFCTSTFSTYVYGDYIKRNSTGFVKENFNYYKITNINNLGNKHLEVDIEEDNKKRI